MDFFNKNVISEKVIFKKIKLKNDYEDLFCFIEEEPNLKSYIYKVTFEDEKNYYLIMYLSFMHEKYIFSSNKEEFNKNPELKLSKCNKEDLPEKYIRLYDDFVEIIENSNELRFKKLFKK